MPDNKEQQQDISQEPGKIEMKVIAKTMESGTRIRGVLSRTIRYLTLAGCLLAVIVQLDQCYQKLTVPPVTTHTRFHVNDTLWYPALTLCREPAFREEVFTKYGLASSPRYTSHWRHFPWGDISIEQLYAEATFPAKEVLLLYGLNGQEDNVAIESAYFFESGMCHTLLPKTTTTDAGLDVGYSVLVTHSIDHSKDKPSGWYVFVHEASENWTEYKMQALGRQEALYVEVGEELHVRLSVNEFVRTSAGQTRNCVDNVEDGEVRCTERCRWEQNAIDGCAAPWMPGVDLPECDNYNDTNRLIIRYLRFDKCTGECCGCKTNCRFVRYDALPITRKPFPRPMSQIYVFFTSRLVTLMEERPAYDLSSFVAEIGGSLGFLLGLSVLGLISFAEKGLEIISSRLPGKCFWQS